MNYRGLYLTDSKDFNEIYNRFMESYDLGGDIDYITKEILNEYHRDFSLDNVILHDVYFSIAYSQWMCGNLQGDILKIVGDIIVSKADIMFYRETLCTEEEISIRDNHLSKFLAKIMIPNENPRPRYTKNRNPLYSWLRIGGVYSYLENGRRRVFVVVDKVDYYNILKPLIFCCIMRDSYEKVPDITEIGNEEIGSMGLFLIGMFPTPYKLKYEYSYYIPDKKFRQLFDCIWIFAQSDKFYGKHKWWCPLTLDMIMKSDEYGAYNFFGIGFYEGGVI